MNEEIMKKIIDDTYDDEQEESLLVMLRDFYNRRMLSIIITLWTLGLSFMAIAIYCGVKFFYTDSTQYQIMYAAIVTIMCGYIRLVKVLAWQIINRNNVKREIKRLELRVIELSNQLTGK